MTTYYINPTTGNDANNGTTGGTPKQNIQLLFDGSLLNPGDVVEIQTGTHTIGDKLLTLYNFKRGNAGSYITVQGAGGCVLNITRVGIEAFGSTRFLWFKNLNMNVTTGSGVLVDGRQNTGGADGLGAAHIIVEGCTIDGGASAWLANYGITISGADYTQVIDNIITATSTNANTAAIRIAKPYTFDATAGIHVRVERNKVYVIGNSATASATPGGRHGIVLEDYHTDGLIGDPLLPNRLIGDTLVANNIVINTAGSGIVVFKGGQTNSTIAVVNNTVIAPFAYALGGATPQTGIGGYGQSTFHHITFFNNLVYGDLARFNYAWISFDGTADSVLGARNWSYNGANQFAPVSTEPLGWLYGTANPSLVNPLTTGLGDYAPQAGSPLIGAGVLTFNGWSAPTLDFNKTTRTGAPTIGAIQINSGAGSAPVCNFTVTPALPGAGAEITFTDTSTNTPNSFQWSFGDGTSSLLASPVKIYPGPGTYIVTHVVSNAFGAHTKVQAIVVAPGGV